MTEETIKHLQLIQGVISRLAGNSFSYKAWAITIVAALFALSAKEVKAQYLFVAIIPTIAFWGLDAYYLRQERLFRKLYDSIRKGLPNVLGDGPFSMNTKPFQDEVASWLGACFSRTIVGLYAPMLLIVLVVGIIAGTRCD
jgi:hypothetical protein